MEALRPTYILIKPNGDLDHELAGMPSMMIYGYSIRLIETIYQRSGYGSFHISTNGAVGSVNMLEEPTRFKYVITVDGTNLPAIEAVRKALKEKIKIAVAVIT